MDMKYSWTDIILLWENHSCADTQINNEELWNCESFGKQLIQLIQRLKQNCKFDKQFNKQ